MRTRVGETELVLSAGAGEPFYHVALLVPGDRWAAALAWARERVELLPDRETGEEVFVFDGWAARAVYLHDPAGTILELIAHRGLEDGFRTGSFDPAELIGVSEVGLVGDPAALAAALADGLGIDLWDGVVGVPGRLGFVGERGRTVIVCPEGRGWLPTGRPAEPHPVGLELTGTGVGRVELPGGHVAVGASGG